MRTELLRQREQDEQLRRAMEFAVERARQQMTQAIASGGSRVAENGGRRLHALSLRGAKRRGNPFSFLGRIPMPVCGGAHGPRPTGHSGHVGRTESPVVMEYLPVPAR